MEELEAKLDRLLSSPDGMKRIEEMMAAFGAAPASSPEPSPPPASSPPTEELPDLAQIGRLLPLIGQLHAPDDNAALLKALRPHLQDARQKRLDEAEKMLRLWRLLPLIKDFGKGESDHDSG